MIPEIGGPGAVWSAAGIGVADVLCVESCLVGSTLIRDEDTTWDFLETFCRAPWVLDSKDVLPAELSGCEVTAPCTVQSCDGKHLLL